MGRIQEFDTTEVVRAARGIFWQRGYESASLPDLERATGIGRSSLYHAFGSKRGLFDAAVQSYLDEVVRPRLRPLTGGTVAPDAVENYLSGLRSALTDDTSPAREGCLLINTAGAPIGRDAAVTRTIAAYRDELRGAVGSGVRASSPELDDDRQAVLADAVTALVIAALALVRVVPGEAARGIDTALALVREARGASDDRSAVSPGPVTPCPADP